MVVTNEEIMEGFLGEDALQNLVDKLKSENEVSNFKLVVERIQDLFAQQGQSKQKYFAMKNQADYVIYFIKAKNLFDIFGELALCDKDKPYEERAYKIFGAKEDPSFSQSFYDILMECISYWGTKYAADQKGNPTIFAKLLEKLCNQGFKPKIELQLFELTEEQKGEIKKLQYAN